MDDLMKMRVKKIMTRSVRSVEVPGHRSDALDMMKRYHISGLPVVEKGGSKFLGLITRHDIYNQPSREQIAMLYNDRVETISVNSTVANLIGRFIRTRQYWMPVLGSDKITLVGIVTPADLLRYIEHLGKGRSVIDFVDHRHCIPVHQSTPLSVAMHILRITRVPALPVIDGDTRLTGIVSDLDVFRMLISEENSHHGIKLDVEDDDWTWEGLRNFQQVLARPNMKLPDITVDRVMIREVQYLYPNSEVSGAAKTMRIRNIGQLPICDSDDVLLGMLCNYDLLPLLLP